ncbi:MAG: ATP-dependent Clp protease proteolytic subunit [candidate division NC10 bacterium]|nr:ATP-dependent Clp protease proteolytic subunit [candidate division NC10 bacterium]
MDVMWNLLWILFLLSAFMPLVQARLLERARLRFLRRLERQRGSRVITLIHRQESRTILGIPVARYIDIDDSEQVLRAIRLTPRDMPIDLILHTPGGLVLATEQIANALKNHQAKVTVIIPHYAMSGGTLVALAADEILMDENAVIGPVDPQVGEYPAASILKVIGEKDKNELEDKTLILADLARKATSQIQECVEALVRDRMPPERAKELITSLTEGRWTHDYPITFAQAERLGFPVRREVPVEVYALMDLYPQPRHGRPSVQFVPLPYRREPAPPAPRTRS